MIIDYNDKLEDKIAKEIYTLILSYMEYNKSVDLNFLENIADIVVKNKNLKDYLTAIKIDNNIKDVATHCSHNKSITVNVNTIIYILKLIKIFNGKELLFYSYLEVVEVLLHELEHVNQDKIFNYENSLESLIVRKTLEPARKLSQELSITKGIKNNLISLKIDLYNIKYHKNYIYSPAERLAYIKSTLTTIKIAELFGSKNICDYENLFLITNYCRGYYKKINPTKYYLKIINPKFNWHKIEEKIRDISFLDRITLGLEINKNELQSLVNNIKSSMEITEQNYKSLKLKNYKN